MVLSLLKSTRTPQFRGYTVKALAYNPEIMTLFNDSVRVW
jgi:hypothetical protein